MLSIIVCSRNKVLDTDFTVNISNTVGVEYELICIDNSTNQHSIYSAYNEGIRLSKFPFLCLVHEDVKFHQVNWGVKIIDHLSIPNVGIIGVAGGDVALRIPSLATTLNHSQNLIQSDKSGKKPVEFVKYPTNYNFTRRSVVLLDGVFLCMNRTFFDSIKFDETLTGFHGYDYDICIQSILSGYQNYVIYDISIEHFSRGVQDANYFRTLAIVFEKWRNQLPIFEQTIPKTDQLKMLPRLERMALDKLLKKLVRTHFDSKQVVNVISKYAHKTSLTGINYIKTIINLRIFLIRFTSIMRHKMEPKQSTKIQKISIVDEPKVSIITPCYNREKYIRETLECLQKMNYQNWECIVVDDASTDKSAEIIKEIARNDSRIQYHLQAKSPIPVTKNRAISFSCGEYILPLDSDDLISPNYLSEAVEILKNNSQIKIVYCDAKYFGSRKGKWLLEPYSFDELLIANCIHNTALFRRIDYDKAGGYNPAMFASEEWDLWINMLKTGGDVYKIEKPYFFYRKHPESTIDNYRDREPEMRKLVYENNKELYENLLEKTLHLLAKHRIYKEKYNKYRRLTLRKPIK